MVAFGAWFFVASNYDYNALAGTYQFRHDDEKCTLYLYSDRTFLEELSDHNVVKQAHGHWHRYGEAHVSFSSEFITVSGQQLNAAKEAHGQFDKRYGIFTSLTLAPVPDGPAFRKKFF
jgi:hypothetical protein